MSTDHNGHLRTITHTQEITFTCLRIVKPPIKFYIYKLSKIRHKHRELTD